MNTPISESLQNWLAKGGFRIGQVQVLAQGHLHHIDDAGREDLQVFADPHAALELARYDDAGKYRPLKTAPNLRHGWRLEMSGLEAIRLALDFLYPAALGLAVAQERGGLAAVDLRETLGRQTGMYAVVKKITDNQAEAVIASTCRGEPGCLRQILWNISSEYPLPDALKRGPDAGEGRPLLCAEACNLLVAAGRVEVKKPVAGDVASASN